MIRPVALFFALALSALAACSDRSVTAPAPHEDELLGNRGKDERAPRIRRLSGACATSFTFLTPPTAPVQQLHIDGECAFTPMGRLTLSSEQTVTFGPGGRSTIVNTTTYTAPNGDRLFATFTGTGTAPDASGNVCFSGRETYTGGTGRFAGATGSAAVRGCASIPRGRGFFVANGSIRY